MFLEVLPFPPLPEKNGWHSSSGTWSRPAKCCPMKNPGCGIPVVLFPYALAAFSAAGLEATFRGAVLSLGCSCCPEHVGEVLRVFSPSLFLCLVDGIFTISNLPPRGGGPLVGVAVTDAVMNAVESQEVSSPRGSLRSDGRFQPLSCCRFRLLKKRFRFRVPEPNVRRQCTAVSALLNCKGPPEFPRRSHTRCRSSCRVRFLLEACRLRLLESAHGEPYA